MDYIQSIKDNILSTAKEPPIFTDPKLQLIDWKQPSLWIAAAAILFNPIFWNIAAQNEYHNSTLTKTFKSPYIGCYILAATIFGLGLFRDSLYATALNDQPLYPPLLLPEVGYALLVVGATLVVTSTYRLGITGTYLGDYFGILMDAPVTTWPFSWLSSPMYVGSTCSFLGWALVKGKLAGAALTGLVAVMYVVALRFEDPFTEIIYSKRDSNRVTRSMAAKHLKKA